MIRRPPRSPLFPSTTLFRSARVRVGPEAVRAQPPPQRGAADSEPAGRLGQLAVRLLQGVEDRQSFTLRERLRVIAVGQEDRLTELRRALLQRAGPAKIGRASCRERV